MEEDGVAALFYPPVFAGEYALFPLAEIVAVAHELDHFSFGRMGGADGNVLLRQELRLVGFVRLVEEHEHLVGGIVGFGGLEQFQSGIGDVANCLGRTSRAVMPIGPVAHDSRRY